MGGYLPGAAGEREAMLGAIGVKSVEELYADIPAAARYNGRLSIPDGLSELSLVRLMETVSRGNKEFEACFRGAGAYRHFIPSIVADVASKEEFVTAYTPYQAEASQGVLQVIFEFQSMICELTGMDASNASVYDGCSAAAEAVAMCRERGRAKALVSACAHPHVIETIRTYCFGSGVEVGIIPENDGATDIAALEGMLDDKCACVYFAQPNFFGRIEDAKALCNAVKASGAKSIMAVNPIAMGLLASPGECGADIAVGDGQPLGMPLSFGGPYLGFMAAKNELARRLPGRIVGQTVDSRGQRAFVLTMQAREQHIRREKAQSNICSNQALCALTAGAYLAAMGARGLKECAQLCHSKAEYLAKKLAGVGFARRHSGAIFHEFVTECPVDSDDLTRKLAEHGMLGGLPLGDGGMLWCATELITAGQIDGLIYAIREMAA